MDIQALITPQELRDLLDEFLPCTIGLDAEDDRKQVSLERPQSVKFLPDEQTIRVHTSGSVQWPVPVVGDTFSVDELVIDLLPSVQRRGADAALVFDARLKALDVRHVPSVLDDLLLRKINETLEELDLKGEWAFTSTLTNRIDVAGDELPFSALSMFVSSGSIAVETGGLRLTAPMDFYLLRSDLKLPPTV